MEYPVNSKKQQALRKAEDQFTRAANRESQFREERAKANAVDAAKIARLRGLRLAKEAADREAAEAERLAGGDEQKPAPRARRVSKVTKITVSN